MYFEAVLSPAKLAKEKLSFKPQNKNLDESNKLF